VGTLPTTRPAARSTTAKQLLQERQTYAVRPSAESAIPLGYDSPCFFTRTGISRGEAATVPSAETAYSAKADWASVT
jgi:hypothetical protein